MRELLRLVLILASLAASALAAAGQAPVLTGLPGPLEWQNAPAAWHIDKGQALWITAGKSTDWFISPMDGMRKDNSPRLVFKPAEDFVLGAKVTVDFQSQWDGGALVLYVSDTVWAKLCLEMTIDKHPAVVSVVTKGLSDDSNSIAVEGGSVFLKVAKAGQAVIFYASKDGRSWMIIRAFSLGPAPDLRVGFSSQAPVGGQCTTEFTQVQYLPKRVDLWSGK